MRKKQLKTRISAFFMAVSLSVVGSFAGVKTIPAAEEMSTTDISLYQEENQTQEKIEVQTETSPQLETSAAITESPQSESIQPESTQPESTSLETESTLETASEHEETTVGEDVSETITETAIETTVEESPEEEQKRITRLINSELDKIGISYKLKGREYIFCAIDYMLHQDPKTFNDVSPLQYVADKYKMYSSSIGRGIQTAINKAWKRSAVEDLEKFYTAKISASSGVPSAMELIFFYYNKIKEQL